MLVIAFGLIATLIWSALLGWTALRALFGWLFG
jgi:hypothetical protein